MGAEYYGPTEEGWFLFWKGIGYLLLVLISPLWWPFWAIGKIKQRFWGPSIRPEPEPDYGW